jgi:hypothetical protein
MEIKIIRVEKGIFQGIRGVEFYFINDYPRISESGGNLLAKLDQWT